MIDSVVNGIDRSFRTIVVSQAAWYSGNANLSTDRGGGGGEGERHDNGVEQYRSSQGGGVHRVLFIEVGLRAR